MQRRGEIAVYHTCRPATRHQGYSSGIDEYVADRLGACDDQANVSPVRLTARDVPCAIHTRSDWLHKLWPSPLTAAVARGFRSSRALSRCHQGVKKNSHIAASSGRRALPM